MTEKTKTASARPWRGNRRGFLSADHKVVCEMWTNMTDEDAAFVLHAVNSHDSLVARIAELEAALDESQSWRREASTEWTRRGLEEVRRVERERRLAANPDSGEASC